jgi:membrane protein required for colicin V production
MNSADPDSFEFHFYKPTYQMNYIDIVLIILLLAGAVRGFRKGFIFETAILGTLFLGMYAGFHFAYLLQPSLLKIGKINPHTISFISFLIIFLLVAVGIFFLARLFEGLVNIAALGIFNKILGALFGLFKYTFIISIILYFFNQLDVRHHFISPDKKAESHFYYPVMKVAPVILPVLTAIKKDAELKLDEMKKSKR